jgi:hypothetical protein
MNEIIEMNSVSLNDIKQTAINDSGRNSLCLALANIQIAGSILRLRALREGKTIAPYTLEDIDRIVDEAVKNGGLRDLDKDGNSDDGFVADHEKIAAAAGLFDVKKVYEKINKYRISALLQWGSCVEIRDEGRHSMIAYAWYVDANQNMFCRLSDPWPKTNDVLLDCQRWMTQRMVDGKLVDSRSVEHIGYYIDNKTKWV